MFNLFKSKKIETPEITLAAKGKCSGKSNWVDYMIPTEDELVMLKRFTTDVYGADSFIKGIDREDLVVVFETAGRYRLMSKQDFVKEYFILEESV
jgi:hypothetical protein